MAAPLTGPWSGETVISAASLNKTTHGSGTTTEREAITSWPTDRPFFDSDLGIWFKNVGTESDITWAELGGVFYGDGHDGDLTVSADQTISGEKHYENLTINANRRLTVTSPQLIYVSGNLVLNGEIFVTPSTDGGDAGAAGTVGNDGGDGGDGDDGVLGGAGGDGGDGEDGDSGLAGRNGGAGGDGGSARESLNEYGKIKLTDTILREKITSTFLGLLHGAGGGGGGGAGRVNPAYSGGPGAGGAGGGGGGGLIIFAKSVTFGGTISADGADGGDGAQGYGHGSQQDGGGAGGGGGGVIIIVSNSYVKSASAAISVDGGAGGDGHDADDGADGSDGLIVELAY